MTVCGWIAIILVLSKVFGGYNAGGQIVAILIFGDLLCSSPTKNIIKIVKSNGVKK